MNKVEDNVGSGLIVHLEQFPRLSNCLEKPSALEAPEGVCMWESGKRDDFVLMNEEMI